MSGENLISGLFTEPDPETVAFFEEARRKQVAAALLAIAEDTSLVEVDYIKYSEVDENGHTRR